VVSTIVAAWPSVALGAVMRKSGEWIDVDPEQEYAQVTVRLWGKGVALRGRTSGTQIAASRQVAVRTGQFILSRIDARNGAFGLVPSELDGALVSNDFPAFDLDTSRIVPAFLAWLSKTHDFVELCQRASEGTTNRVRLKEERFLAAEIPLPPLDEQRRIVARIEALAARIEEARGLKRFTASESQRFWKVLSRIARDTQWPVRRLDEMVEFLDGRRIPLSEAERATRRGQYPYYGASGIIDYVDDYIFDEDLLLLSEDGANLINRSTPIAFVADGKYWVNNHAHVLRPLPAQADLRFLAYALADFDVSIFNFASAQAKLNQRNARKITFPLPPLDEQLCIVRHLDELKSKVTVLEKLQADSAAELDALLPSVLDQAFRGEL
jgi:type I restriction enzyme S subunit